MVIMAVGPKSLPSMLFLCAYLPWPLVKSMAQAVSSGKTCFSLFACFLKTRDTPIYGKAVDLENDKLSGNWTSQLCDNDYCYLGGHHGQTLSNKILPYINIGWEDPTLEYVFIIIAKLFLLMCIFFNHVIM